VCPRGSRTHRVHGVQASLPEGHGLPVIWSRRGSAAHGGCEGSREFAFWLGGLVWVGESSARRSRRCHAVATVRRWLMVDDGGVLLAMAMPMGQGPDAGPAPAASKPKIPRSVCSGCSSMGLLSPQFTVFPSNQSPLPQQFLTQLSSSLHTERRALASLRNRAASNR